MRASLRPNPRVRGKIDRRVSSIDPLAPIMTTEEVRDYLQRQLFIENSVVRESKFTETCPPTATCSIQQVSYRLLSRELGIHVNDARLYAAS